MRALRRLPLLSRLTPLWRAARPLYDRLIARLYAGGVRWNINGTDQLLLSGRLRMVSEHHEPAAWRLLLDAVRPGECFADVGASSGLYTLAAALRTAPGGQVVAFEPDPASFALLREHIRLNGLGSRVEAIDAAVGAAPGSLLFSAGKGPFSHVGAAPGAPATRVRCTTLDEAFRSRAVHVMKVDVEGFEEQVLLGGATLLGDMARGPRLLYIELHHELWPRLGLSTTQAALFARLRELGYALNALDGAPLHDGQQYGEVVARRIEAGQGSA